MDAKDKAAEKADEQVTLDRSSLWMLKIAAATGVIGFISHGASAAAWIYDRLH